MPPDTPLFDQIKAQIDTLSVNQRVLARHVLENYQRVAFSNVKELSQLSGVSEATVVRFAKALGFSGYPALQKEIRRLVRVDLKGPERFQLTHQTEKGSGNSLTRVIRKELENIANFEEIHDEKAFREAVDMLGTASELVVCGTRSTASLANHLSFGLGKMGLRVTRLATLGEDSFDLIGRLDKQACVVFIGFPRYLNRLLALLRFAREQGLRTLALTDSPFSPLKADINLYVPVESASFVAFHCAPLILINSLLHALSLHDEHRTLSALSRFEALASEQNFFFKDQQPRRNGK